MIVDSNTANRYVFAVMMFILSNNDAIGQCFDVGRHEKFTPVLLEKSYIVSNKITRVYGSCKTSNGRYIAEAFDIKYDSIGNILQEQYTGFLGKCIYKYTYDTLNRIISIGILDSSIVTKRLNYSYSYIYTDSILIQQRSDLRSIKYLYFDSANYDSYIVNIAKGPCYLTNKDYKSVILDACSSYILQEHVGADKSKTNCIYFLDMTTDTNYVVSDSLKNGKLSTLRKLCDSIYYDEIGIRKKIVAYDYSVLFIKDRNNIIRKEIVKHFDSKGKEVYKFFYVRM